MSHEKEIPEYAMQPAREPKFVEAEAIYHNEKVVQPEKEMKITYQFEEDLLVPDIKPDMREILIMDGDCDFSPEAKKVTPKTDDLLPIMGTVTLQTLYAGEGEDQEPVAVTSKVPYKYQWALNPQTEADAVFSCRVKNLEYMIINERKFRVKITLEFSARLFVLRTFSLFQGLKDEPLEMRTDKIDLTALELTKHDVLTVDEVFQPKDKGNTPQNILKQDFVITENYRQATKEKIVINGFIHCSILYTAEPEEKEDGSGRTICHYNRRIEFTQFIPIEREHREKSWSDVKTYYQNDGLAVSVERDEENPERVGFRIRGEVKTRIELYRQRLLETVSDAYHREKNFACDFFRLEAANRWNSSTGETAIREIASLPEGAKAKEILYCQGKIMQSNCVCEKGRIVVTGKAACSVLWKDAGGDVHVTRHTADFRGSVEIESLQPGQGAVVEPVVRSAWAEMISEKQAEINCSILLLAETFETGEIIRIENPRFVDGACSKQYPMVIVSVEKGDTLWGLAKKYKTTEEDIRKANRLEGEPEIGSRLLMIK